MPVRLMRIPPVDKRENKREGIGFVDMVYLRLASRVEGYYAGFRSTQHRLLVY